MKNEDMAYIFRGNILIMSELTHFTFVIILDSLNKNN